jgi:hypothetical protein
MVRAPRNYSLHNPRGEAARFHVADPRAPPRMPMGFGGSPEVSQELTPVRGTRRPGRLRAELASVSEGFDVYRESETSLETLSGPALALLAVDGDSGSFVITSVQTPWCGSHSGRLRSQRCKRSLFGRCSVTVPDAGGTDSVGASVIAWKSQPFNDGLNITWSTMRTYISGRRLALSSSAVEG